MKHILIQLIFCSCFYVLNAESILINNPGGLSKVIEEKGLFDSKELTVRGELNEDDIFYLCSLAKGQLEHLDLKDCNITAYGEPYSLPYHAFREATHLQTIVLPSRIRNLPESCFSGCTSLQTFQIPRDVKTISPFAFFATQSLQSFMVETGNTAFISDGIALFDIGQKELVMFPRGREGHYVIPEGVKAIESYSFHMCTKLKSVKFPMSLERIESAAFLDCTEVSYIEIPDNVVRLGGAFENNTALTKVTIGKGLKECWETFQGCPNLSDVYVFITTPFDAEAGHSGRESFDGIGETTILHVPQGTAEKYKDAYGWRCFKNIIEMTDSEMENLDVIERNAPNSYVYDLSGRKTDPNVQGIYIEGDKKVMR